MTLDGWDAIADHLERISGIRRTTRTLRRWAALPNDPLPHYTTPGGRDVIADSDALEAWWTRAKHRPIQLSLGTSTEGF